MPFPMRRGKQAWMDYFDRRELLDARGRGLPLVGRAQSRIDQATLESEMEN